MRLEPLTLMLDGAVPIPAGAIVAYLAARPREASAFVLDLADAIIAEQDRLGPDPDLEPSLGAQNPTVAASGRLFPREACEAYPEAPRRWRSNETSQRHWSHGGREDVEEVDEDGGDIQDEPHDGHDVEDACMSDDVNRGEHSLGWGNGVNQLRLGYGTDEDEHTAPERLGKGFVRCGPDDVELNGDEREQSDNGVADSGGVADAYARCEDAFAGLI